MTAPIESLTALLEYLDLLQDFPAKSQTCNNNNNNPHKLGFQIIHVGG